MFRHLLCACVYFALETSFQVTHAQEPKPVVVASVIEAEVNSGQRVVGTVMPLRTTTVGSAVDGRVLEYRINQGDPVVLGQVLAQLRTSTLRIELAAAEAELDLFEQQLAELRNGSRAEDIAQAKATMLSAKAGVLNATTRLQRVESLVATRAASSSELDEAKRQFDVAKFSLQATEALFKRVEAGPRREAVAQAEARVELQRQRRALLKDRIAKFTIRAPFDGFVAMEHTEVGAWISQGDPIAQIIQLDEVEIQTPVIAESAVQLRKGEAVRVEFPELPNQLLTGTIDRIVPIADPRVRTFPVAIRLSNIMRDGEPTLLAGMMARVDLPAGRRQTLPLVPKDALVLNGNDRAVYVVDLGANDGENGVRYGTVRKVQVDLGVALGDGIQVKGKLQVNDLVVVVGNERLVPNAKVKILESPKTIPVSR